MRNITAIVRSAAGALATAQGKLPRRPGRKYGIQTVPAVLSQALNRAGHGPGLATMSVGKIMQTRWPT
jgi:hypothetical protein